MEEIWKDIIEYEGFYQISNQGNVRSVPRIIKGHKYEGKIIKQHIDIRSGLERFSVELNKNGVAKRFVVARLVATAFIRPPKENEEINHLDENPSNNAVDNLEWCTHKYNCNYGTRVQRIKEKQNMAVLQYTLSGEFIAEYTSMHIAAEAIKADAGHICDCCLGNRKWAYGYFWRYKDEVLYEQAKKHMAEVIERGKKGRAEKFAKLALNVIQMTIDGKIIAVHQSSKLAAQAVGSFSSSIINCCNGKITHVKGFKFVYERDYLRQNDNMVNGGARQLSLF